MISTSTLPSPDAAAQQQSDQLLTHIKQKIVEAGGRLTFADYMHLCLYAPGLGYYSAGSYKLGEHGDFTTAPEISSLFSRSLTQHIEDVFQQIKHNNILEFGAGSGKMAADILHELAFKQCFPEHYYIIEASADLQQRQAVTIKNHVPHLFDRVEWLVAIPEGFMGVVLANEVCDAMPVHRLHFENNKFHELYIENVNSTIQWCEGALSQPLLADRAIEIQSLTGIIDGYTTEVNLAADAWVASLADNLKCGAIFIIDYGYSQANYYHPQRTDGTLMCYFRHQGHDNPLILPGLQDITAHVNFTSLAQSALESGLDVEGFQSQADFLLAGGITELVSTDNNTDEWAMLQQANEIKQLTLPSEMGESFKVLTL
ncbi:MAG: class I SAM-dependent methyltransferase, partial [Methylophagaceae bacterium]